MNGELSAEFPLPPQRLADALIYCDMTTGPSGERLSVTDRLAEIHSRYGDEHLVSRSIRRATPDILAAVATTEAKLTRAASS